MPQQNIKNGTFILGDCLEEMKQIPDGVIDLTVTSPPYDNLRDYKGYCFDFEGIAKELYRLTSENGVLVWNVNDAKIKGSETGTSFRQALYFMDECGFLLNDTMIWHKGGFSAVGALVSQYAPVFEYMFVFCKSTKFTFNPLKDRENKIKGKLITKSKRQQDGTIKNGNSYISSDFGQRYNIWEQSPHRQKGENTHPAPFPVNLVQDHILSWSNEGDLVFDPFGGSGTTAIAAENTKRRWVLCEISEEYANKSVERIINHKVDTIETFDEIPVEP